MKTPWERADSMRALAAAATIVAVGCGPLQASAFLNDTETMLDTARASDAERLAVYEWTAANLYFHKAKEEVGYSDYEHAVDYAKKALEFATKARVAAQKAGKKSGDAAAQPHEGEVRVKEPVTP